MGLRCPPQNYYCVLTVGDPTAPNPPFPLLANPVLPPAGVGAPRDFMAPHTYGGSPYIQGGTLSLHWPHLRALTWNYVKVLSCTHLVASGEALPPRSPSEPRELPGPALTLGVTRLRRLQISVAYAKNVTHGG